MSDGYGEAYSEDLSTRDSRRRENARAATERGEYDGFGQGSFYGSVTPARLPDGTWPNRYRPLGYPSGPADYSVFDYGNHDIDRFMTVLGWMNQNAILNHARFWRRCGTTLSQFGTILEGRKSALQESWQGDAADMFMERVGAVRFSMDEWKSACSPIARSLENLSRRVRSAKAKLFRTWYHYQYMLAYLESWSQTYRGSTMWMVDPHQTDWEPDFSHPDGFVARPAFSHAHFRDHPEDAHHENIDWSLPFDMDERHREIPVDAEAERTIAKRYHRRAAEIFQPVANAMVVVARAVWVHIPVQFYGHTYFNDSISLSDFDMSGIGGGVPGIDLPGGGAPGGMPDLPQPDLDALGDPVASQFAGGPADSQLRGMRAPPDARAQMNFLNNLRSGLGPPPPPLPDWMSLPVNRELARLAGLPDNLPAWPGAPATPPVDLTPGNLPVSPPAGAYGPVPGGAYGSGPSGAYRSGGGGAYGSGPGGGYGTAGTGPGGAYEPDGVAPLGLPDGGADTFAPGVYSTEPQNPALPGAAGPDGQGLEQGLEQGLGQGYGQGMMPPPMMPPVRPPAANQPGQQSGKSGPGQAGQGAGGMAPPLTPGMVPPGTVSQRGGGSPNAPQQRSAALPGTAGPGRGGSRGGLAGLAGRAALRGLAGRGKPAAANPPALEPDEDDLWAAQRAKGPLSGVAPPAPAANRPQVADPGKGTLSGVAPPAADQPGRPQAAS